MGNRWMMRAAASRLAFKACLFAGAAGLASPALAQDDATPPPAAEEDPIIVTGTLIRGVAPVGAPVVSVDAGSILKSGRTDLTSVLRSIPQVSTLGISGSTTGTTANGQGTNTTFASGVNIHGLGSQATLTLIDGHRGAPGGQFGNYFDPSNVPVIAIGRIDVLTDGASAIYGSDAMAGVVNLGLRRNFDGLEARASVSFADDYVANNQAVIIGKSWSSGSVMLALDRTYTPKLLASDRPDLYISDGPSVFTGSGAIPRGYSPFTANPNVIVGGVSYAAKPGATSFADFTPNAQNIQGAWYNSTALPEFERYSAVLTAEQDLTDTLQIYTTGLYSRRKFYGFGHTAGSTVAAESTLSLPSTNPYFITGFPGSPSSVTVRLSHLQDLGPSETDGLEQSWLGVLGARLDLGSDWQIDVFGQRAGNRVDRNIYNNINTCGLQGGAGCAGTGAINDTNPATAFNPFGVRSEAVAARYSSYRESNSYYDSTIVAGKLDGPLFELPGGQVHLAVGGEYRHDEQGQELIDSRRTPSPTLYTVITSSKPMTVWSAFGEVVVPLFGPDNAIPGFQRLDLSAAVRYSDYDILSSASTNPKFGLTWEPIDDLSISSTYAKSFRVNLASTDKNNQPLNRIRTIPDYFSPTGFSNMLQLGGGNPDLKPEESETFTAGFDWRPSGGLSGLRLYASYFDIKYSGVIDTPGVPILNSVTQSAEAIYGAYLLRRPSTVTPGANDAAFDAIVASFYNDPTFSGGGTPDQVQVIGDGRSQNAGIIKADGLDFVASYDWDLGGSQLSAGVNGEIFFDYKRSLTPTGALISRRGLIDYPNKFVLRGNLGWSNDNFAIDVFGNYQPSYTNTYTTPRQKISAYFTLDATVSYTTSDDAGLLGGLRLAVSAINLLDKQPPYAAVFEQKFDSSVASMLGRVVTLSVGKSF